MITAAESERTSRLNAKRVKSMTGGDPVYCAHKGKPHFTYYPQYKIWISSNFGVNADASDDALWSRLRIINFPNSHLGNEDFSLEEKLTSNIDGILRWAVDGAKEWYKRKGQNIGLGRPAIITQLVNSQRHENDTVQQWIDDCCLVGPNYHITGVKLTNSYKWWCEDMGYKPLGGKRLGEALRRKGYEYKNIRIDGKQKKCWVGLGIEETKLEDAKKVLEDFPGY